MATNVIYPVIDALTFNNSYARYVDLPVKRPCDFSCLDMEGQCPECVGELPFAYFASPTGMAYFQFRFPDNFNPDPLNPVYGWKESAGDYWLEIDVLNGDGSYFSTTETADIASAYMVGHKDGNTFQNICIDFSKFYANVQDCFAFRIRKCVPSVAGVILVEDVDTTFPACGTTANPIGSRLYRSDQDDVYICTGPSGWVLDSSINLGDIVLLVPSGDYLVSNGPGLGFDPTDAPEPTPGECGETEECFTPWFRKVDCQKTVEFTSPQSSGTDCFGNIFDEADVFLGTENLKYIESLTVQGSLEIISYPVETVRSDNNRFIKSTQNEKALVRTNGITLNAAARVASILNTNGFTIQGVSWDTSGEIGKNNDKGSLWYLNFEVEREICETEQDCNI